VPGRSKASRTAPNFYDDIDDAVFGGMGRSKDGVSNVAMSMSVNCGVVKERRYRSDWPRVVEGTRCADGCERRRHPHRTKGESP